jgi:dipeptidyl aminopeptidase/acylaminoacyl peptidase
VTELTPELIADLTTPQDLQISPDGKQIVYTLRSLSKKEENATSSLWMAATDGSRPARQFTSDDAENDHPRWSPDGSQIAFLSDRAKPGTAQLYSIAVDGGEARPLTPTDNKKPVGHFAWSPGGGQIAFISADEPSEEDERREKERDDARVYGERRPYGRLRLLSLATHEITTLVSGDRHIADVVWHPNGTELAYVVWQTPDLESLGHEVLIERVSLAGDEPHVVCRIPNGIGSLTWSSDGQTLLFIGSISGKMQASNAVYAVPVQGGEPRHLAFGETNCAADLRPLQQDQHIAACFWEGLETKFCVLNTATGSTTALFPVSKGQYIAASYPGWDVRFLHDHMVLAITQCPDHELWNVWAGRSENGVEVSVLKRVSSHQEAFAGLTFGSQEAFYWSAPDGLELDGILVRPPDAPADQPMSTVVLVHGGPYGRWGRDCHLRWGDWAQWLALAGYVVLMPNPRGGLGHGDQFAAAARGDVGGADYADVMAAVDAAVERGIADPDRLGIGGWSQGGFMTAWAVTQTDRFKAGIMGAGVSDWGMMVMTSDVPDFERELGGSAPWEGPGPHLHAKLSPISFAHRVKTPLLILHGENDARVPLSQAVGFHRALREHQVPTEFVIYPREPHGISERAHQIDLLRRVRSWYDRWLRS